MAEQMKSITDARKDLPTLSQTAQRKMDRYVITHQGRPQSVLVGWNEYQGMKAKAELVNRPKAVASIRKGLAELKEGKRLTSAEVRAKLQVREDVAKAQELAAAVADRSGVETEVVSTVMMGFRDLMREHMSGGGSVTIPGLGQVQMAMPLVEGTLANLSRDIELPHLTKRRKAKR
jgi:PHD/YefM family antitoxin component YafN of YafNO toxin-antitoxin module